MKVRYRFKQAETPDEFEHIFRLNHAVFAGRIGAASARSRASVWWTNFTTRTGT